MLRLFIGIGLQNLGTLNKSQAKLKHLLGNSIINWTIPENFHITLKFLGNVEPYYLNSIERILDEIKSDFNEFTIYGKGFGYFGRKYSPRIIWYGFQEASYLNDLREKIDMSLEQLGFTSEEKEFAPHITLGRVKKLIEKEAFNDFIIKNENVRWDFRVVQFELYQSILSGQGPKYEILKKFII